MRKLHNYDGVHSMERPPGQQCRAVVALAPPTRQAARGPRALRSRRTHETARIALLRGFDAAAPDAGSHKTEAPQLAKARLLRRRVPPSSRIRASPSPHFPTTPLCARLPARRAHLGPQNAKSRVTSSINPTSTPQTGQVTLVPSFENFNESVTDSFRRRRLPPRRADIRAEQSPNLESRCRSNQTE